MAYGLFSDFAQQIRGSSAMLNWDNGGLLPSDWIAIRCASNTAKSLKQVLPFLPTLLVVRRKGIWVQWRLNPKYQPFYTMFENREISFFDMHWFVFFWGGGELISSHIVVATKTINLSCICVWYLHFQLLSTWTRSCNLPATSEGLE